MRWIIIPCLGEIGSGFPAVLIAGFCSWWFLYSYWNHPFIIIRAVCSCVCLFLFSWCLEIKSLFAWSVLLVCVLFGWFQALALSVGIVPCHPGCGFVVFLFNLGQFVVRIGGFWISRFLTGLGITELLATNDLHFDDSIELGRIKHECLSSKHRSTEFKCFDLQTARLSGEIEPFVLPGTFMLCSGWQWLSRIRIEDPVYELRHMLYIGCCLHKITEPHPEVYENRLFLVLSLGINWSLYRQDQI